jgi:type III secretory pathway component EscV
MNKLNKIVAIFQEHKELSLIILILCVIGMIIVPIPHTLMDVLIGVNGSIIYEITIRTNIFP